MNQIRLSIMLIQYHLQVTQAVAAPHFIPHSWDRFVFDGEVVTFDEEGRVKLLLGSGSKPTSSFSYYSFK